MWLGRVNIFTPGRNTSAICSHELAPGGRRSIRSSESGAQARNAMPGFMKRTSLQLQHRSMAVYLPTCYKFQNRLGAAIRTVANNALALVVRLFWQCAQNYDLIPTKDDIESTVSIGGLKNGLISNSELLPVGLLVLLTSNMQLFLTGREGPHSWSDLTRATL